MTMSLIISSNKECYILACHYRQSGTLDIDVDIGGAVDQIHDHLVYILLYFLNMFETEDLKHRISLVMFLKTHCLMPRNRNER